MRDYNPLRIWTPISSYEITITIVSGSTSSEIEDIDQKLLDYLATREANKLLYNREVKVMVYPLILKKWVLPRKVI